MIAAAVVKMKRAQAGQAQAQLGAAATSGLRAAMTVA